MWNFCTLSNEDMPLFIFDLYDEDSSNTMDMKELAGVLRDLASGAEGGSSANGKKVGRAEAIRRRRKSRTQAPVHDDGLAQFQAAVCLP